METDLTQLGILGLVFYFAIREFFNWLPRNGKKQDNKQDIKLAVIEEQLKEIKNNHLLHIQEWMEKHEQDNNKNFNDIKEKLTRIMNRLKIK